MKRDYSVTFVVELANLLAGVLLFKFAATWWGKEGFSEYALGRRTLSLILPALLLGVEIGMPRYIALSKSDGTYSNPKNYLVSGLLIVVSTMIVFALIFCSFKDLFALILFGSSDYHYLVFPITLMLGGLSLHCVCYSYYRGTLNMVNANLIQFLNLGFFPVAVFFLFGNSVSSVFISLGLLSAFSSLLIIFPVLKCAKLSATEVIANIKQLIKYGVGRVPGTLLIVAFLTLPATFTAHMSGVLAAGYVAFGIAVLSMIGSLFSPISIILLPKASQMLQEGASVELKKHIYLILKLATLSTLSIVVVLEIFTGSIIEIYLGSGFLDAVEIVRIIALGAIPYVVYICGRSVIDAFYVRAVNTVNILISFVIFCVISSVAFLLAKSPDVIPFSFVIGLYVLGALSFYEIKKTFKKKFDQTI